MFDTDGVTPKMVSDFGVNSLFVCLFVCMTKRYFPILKQFRLASHYDHEVVGNLKNS